jgi:hypothetical protein
VRRERDRRDMADLDDRQVIPATWVTVASLCMYDSTARERLVLGVRSPSAVSSRHPNVLSTPTMRIPSELVPLLLEEDVKGVGEMKPGQFRSVRAAPHGRIGAALSTSNVTTLIAETVLSRKMGLGDALVTQRLTGEAWVTAIGFDRVLDESLEDAEDTFMITIVVECDRVPDLAPTESYSRLEWVSAEKLGEAVETRDPLLLLGHGYSWEVCLHGLCVRSAAFAHHETP